MGNSVNISCKEVLKRLSSALNTNSDVELANSLGVAKNTVSSWRSRNKIPYEKLVEVSVQHGISLDFLVLGCGEKSRLTIEELMHLKTMDDQLLKYIWDKMESPLCLMDKFPNAKVFSLLTEVYNNISVGLPPHSTFSQSYVRHQANIEIQKTITMYQSFIGLTAEKEKNKEHFHSTQNFNAEVEQVAGRDIVNKDKGDK